MQYETRHSGERIFGPGPGGNAGPDRLRHASGGGERPDQHDPGPGELWDALFQYMDLEILFFTCAAVFVLGLVLAVWDYIRGSRT